MSYLSTDEAYEYNDLACWYQNSVNRTQPPIWTDEHLEELLNDFYIIPKDTPTADVVPKSEVESIITLNSQLEAKIFEQRKEIERLKKYNTDVAFKHYNDGKSELASEIFAEIEENLNNLIRYYKEKREYVTEIEYSELEQRYCDIKIRTFEERLLKIAELKKKYTE